MYKAILVPVTATDADDSSFAAAAALARQFNAHIDALHVRVDPVDAAVGMASDASGATGVLMSGLIDDLEKSVAEREEKAKQAFAVFCERERLPVAEMPAAERGPSAQLHLETGQEILWLTNYAMTADLVVASRGTDEDVGMRSLLEAILMDSGRPLFVATDPSVPAEAIEHIVIAWKSTPQAARAVSAAMPFLLNAKQITAVTVAEQDAERDDAARLLRYLAWHGLRATVERVTPGSFAPADTLLQTAQRKAAGLVVMGAYGHSRLREWVFGGFTQHVLSSAPLPVLISH